MSRTGGNRSWPQWVSTDNGLVYEAAVGVSFWDLDTEDGDGFLFFGSERADFDGIWRVSGGINRPFSSRS